MATKRKSRKAPKRVPLPMSTPAKLAPKQLSFAFSFCVKTMVRPMLQPDSPLSTINMQSGQRASSGLSTVSIVLQIGAMSLTP